MTKKTIKREVLDILEKTDETTALECIDEVKNDMLDKLAYKFRDETGEILETLGAFYVMGILLDVDTFSEVHEGSEFKIEDEIFTVAKVTNPYTIVIRYKNVSLRFVLAHCCPLNCQMVSFIGDAYVYDENDLVTRVIPYDSVSEFMYLIEEAMEEDDWLQAQKDSTTEI